MPEDSTHRSHAPLEGRHTPWALRTEAFPLVAEALRHRATAEEIQAIERQAATRGPRVAGSIVILSLKGVITPRGSFLSMLFGSGPGGLAGFSECFQEAVDDSDVAAIVLDVDSPGGLIDLVPETAAMMREARGSKPIVAVANTMAASAAYWLAAQADELVVTPSGEVGSIGVFCSHSDWSGYDERMGVATTLISAGKFKTEGNPYEPLSADAKAALQLTVDELYGMFLDDVAAGRGASQATVRDTYGEGRMLTAKRALAAGMVDRVETLDDTIARLMGGSGPRAGRVAIRPAGVTDPAAVAPRAGEVDPLEPAEEPDVDVDVDPDVEVEPEVDPVVDPAPADDPAEDEPSDDEDDDESSAAAAADVRARAAAVLLGL